MIAYGVLGHVLGHFGGFLRRGKQMWIGPIRNSMGPTFWEKKILILLCEYSYLPLGFVYLGLCFYGIKLSKEPIIDMSPKQA